VPLLQAKKIIKRYGRTTALRGVDLEVAKGDALVLLGPNGAGKSTLLGILAGRVRPSEGKVTLAGEEARKSSDARQRTGYLAHASLLYPGLTALENLLFYARLYNVKDPADRAAEMLRLVGLWERRDDTVGGFSRGMSQRISIARTLIHDPDLVLLDEPFSGLDFEASRMLADTLGTLKDGERTIVLATHDMEAVDRLGDKVAILGRGRLLHHGSVSTDIREIYTGVMSEGAA
jgi:heme exporter protein A